MTRYWIWAGVIASLIALTACSDSPIRVETDPPPQDDVVRVLREETNFFDALSDDRTVHILELTCNSLDEGNSVESVIAISVDSGMDASDAGPMVVAAATGWCPEHLDSVDEFINTWGGERA